MLPFRQITIEDKQDIEEKFSQQPARTTERCFADLFIWRERYRSQFAIEDGFLFVRSRAAEDKRWYYLFPVGQGDLPAALSRIRQDAAGQPYCLYGCTPAQREQLDPETAGRYLFLEDRDNFDYLYRRQDLAELKGKKLHAKRNFVNRFLEEYEGEWRYEPLDPQRHGDQVLELHRLWRQHHLAGGAIGAEEPDYEGQAIRQALEYFRPLEMRGGGLWIRDTLAAFTMGCLAGDTLTVQLEKALPQFQGAYPMMNQQFIAHGGQDFELVNREEDMGIEGLRKAKLSYHPVELSVKYLLEELP